MQNVSETLTGIENFMSESPFIQQNSSCIVDTANNNVFLYQGLFLVFRKAVLDFLIKQLQAAYGEEWWQKGVERALKNKAVELREAFDKRFGKPLTPVMRPCADLYDILDVADFLPIIEKHWKICFEQTFHDLETVRAWLKEIVAIRNPLAHPASTPLRDDDTWRAFDTMIRFLRPIDAAAADELVRIRSEMITNHSKQIASKPSGAIAIEPKSQTKPYPLLPEKILAILIVIVMLLSGSVAYFGNFGQLRYETPRILLIDVDGAMIPNEDGKCYLRPGEKIKIEVVFEDTAKTARIVRLVAEKGTVEAGTIYHAPNLSGETDRLQIHVTDNQGMKVIFQKTLEIHIIRIL